MSLGNVQITPQLVQAVRDAVDIVSVASEHTRLRKAGRRHEGLCPIHKEKTPSFSVDPVQGLFYCFGCGAGGDAIKLHMLTTGDDFPAAIESLAARFGVPLPSKVERHAGGVRAPERDIEGALTAAASFFTEQLRKNAFPRQYLEDRKIPPALIERFGLGYAPEGWRTLIQALHPRIPMADLEAAGLATRSEKGGEPYDRFRHRLMFPIHNASGRLVGFGGRTLGDDKAKYVNTNETDRFHKGLLLYGLHQAKREIRETSRAVLCEGYFDVIGAVACGVEGAVAGMGTALTPEQAKLLSRFAEEVIIAYDGDTAGENAAIKALDVLLEAEKKLKVRKAQFPDGHDPDSLRLARGEEAVLEAIRTAEDATSLRIMAAIPADSARSPQEAGEAARKVREILRLVSDPIARIAYARLAAGRLRVEDKHFLRLVFEKENVLERLEGMYKARPEPDSVVRTLEEQVLERMIQGEEALPGVEELPPPEVFFGTECRNIYRAFRALYAGAGSRPDARAVQAALGFEGEAIDQMAKILLEKGVTSGRIGLLESLDKLTRRWLGQRKQEIAAEIREAARRNDGARLDNLLKERDRLNRSLHPGTRPGAGDGAV